MGLDFISRGSYRGRVSYLRPDKYALSLKSIRFKGRRFITGKIEGIKKGEAQVDFGQAVVKMGGILRKIFFFVMALPYSDVFFVKAYDRECTETFWDGHVQAFQFFGGVAKRITYDNSRIAASKIIGPRLVKSR